MVSKKSPPPPSNPPAAKASALSLDSMPTVSARSPQSLDEESTLVYGSTKGAAGRLQIEAGSHAGEEVLLSSEPCVIGRSSECALVLRRSAGISRKHAQVLAESGRFYIEDMGSRNGTKLNGERISGRAALKDGDLIGISSEKIRFIGPPMQAAEKPKAPPAPKKPSVQETALVDQPQLEALLAESARPENNEKDKDGTEEDAFADAATSLSRRQSGQNQPAPAPKERGEFDAGVPTSTDAAPAKAQPPRDPVATPPVAPTPAEATPAPPQESTDRRESPKAPRASVPPFSEPSYSTPEKSSSFGLMVALGILLIGMGAVAYDFGLNDGAIFNSLLGDSQAEPLAQAKSAANAGQTSPAATAGGQPPAENPASASGSTTQTPDVAPAAVNAARETKPSAAVKTPKGVPPADTQPPPAGAEKYNPPATNTLARGTLVPVTSTAAGVISDIPVRPGNQVSAGQVVAIISRLPAAQARKKKALRREEKLFAPLAAQGDARAARDLAAVRKELRKVETSRKRSSVRAPVNGTVKEVTARTGQSVGTGSALLVIVTD